MLPLDKAGYFINIEKSQRVLSTAVRFFGFVCDSLRQSFLVFHDKKVTFITLRESILSSSMVTLKTLQRFVGKMVSLSLAILSCKLFLRRLFQAIAQMARSPKGSIKIMTN